MVKHGLLTGAIFFGLLLAGCGSSGAPPSSTAPSSSAAKAPAASSAAASAAPSSSKPAASAPASASGPAKTVQYGAISRTAVEWPIFIAENKGFFKEQNLDVQVTYVGSVAASVQQVVGKSLDIADSTFESSIRGIEGGAPISILGAGMVKLPYSVMAASSVKSAADLKGKKAMMALPKDPLTVFFRRWLKENGVDPSQVDLVFDGATTNRYAALKTGAVQATAITQPFDFRATSEGFHKIADFGSYAKTYAFVALVGRKDWASQNSDTTRRFLAAVSKAVKWLYDPKNKDEAISILDNTIKQDHDLDVKTYDYYVNELKPYTTDLSVPEANVQGVLDTIVEEGDMKTPTPPPSKYLDLQYLPK